MDDHSRQKFFCPAENVSKLEILIVGCGATGRNVASNVARLGVKSITLVDGDHVEAHNIVPQDWLIAACGKSKVEVLKEEINGQMKDVEVISHPKMWTPKVVGTAREFDAIWSTVDNIDVRKVLYEYYKDKTKSFFDIRIGGNLAQMLSVVDVEKSEGWYEKTIFPKGEAAAFGCVQPMSNYMANISAGISVNQFANHYGGKGWTVHKMLSFCAITSTLLPEDPNEYFAEIDKN